MLLSFEMLRAFLYSFPLVGILGFLDRALFSSTSTGVYASLPKLDRLLTKYPRIRSDGGRKVSFGCLKIGFESRL